MGTYDIGSISHSNTISLDDGGSTAVAFKSDGTKMYVSGIYQNTTKQYALSTPWDITTHSYEKELEESVYNIYGLQFKDDGSRMWEIYSTPGQRDLSTPWDVGSADSGTSTGPGGEGGAAFSSDGSMYFPAYPNGSEIRRYDLSTAWDLSNTTYVSRLDTKNSVTDVAFNDDGTKMFILDSADNRVEQYSLSTAWDITTESLQKTKGITSGDLRSLKWGDGGRRLFVLDMSNAQLHSYVGPPAAPSNLSASVSTDDISLSWDNVSNEDGYYVYRAQSSGSSTSDYTQIADLAADTTSYTDSGLLDGEKYYYRISAYNSNGESGLSNEASGVTALPAPNNLTLNT